MTYALTLLVAACNHDALTRPGADAGGGGDLAFVTADLGAPRVIATGQYPQALAVDATTLYWTSQPDKVMAAPLAPGGLPTILVSGLTDPWGLAIDAAHLYWLTGDGQVMKAALDGTNVTTLATVPLLWNVSLAVDATSIYWLTKDGLIQRAALDGGAVTTLVSGQVALGTIRVDATHLYWSAGGSVMRSTLNGQQITTLATLQDGLNDLALDADALYWVTEGGPHGTVKKATLATGQITTLVGGLGAGQAAPVDIAVDPSGVYFGNGSGTVMRVSPSGGAATILATASFPGPLALDATHVYWGELGGATDVVALTK